MVSSILVKGSSWGRLICTEVFHADMKVTEDGVTEILYGVKQYRIKCECGGPDIVIKASEFQGKRNMKDCGCGLSSNDGVHMVWSMSVPYDLMMAVKTASINETAGNMNQWLLRAVRRALGGQDKQEGRKKPISERQKEK